jgi:hypothetical protein
MVAEESDRAALLRPAATPDTASYGATGGRDTEDVADMAIKPMEEKQSKKFKEIWALCLGLWTAWVCF